MSTDERAAQLTVILRDGGADSWEQLLPIVYDELRSLALRRMGNERGQHTLQATALVHEAWMRLSGDSEMEWTSRGHFFGAAARAMQRVLVDHARRVKSLKRGGDNARVSIQLDEFADETEPDRMIALHEAIEQLAREDARAADVARLRFFTGLEVRETALALDTSERTVQREWAFARARLAELLA